MKIAVEIENGYFHTITSVPKFVSWGVDVDFMVVEGTYTEFGSTLKLARFYKKREGSTLSDVIISFTGTHSPQVG